MPSAGNAANAVAAYGAAAGIPAKVFMPKDVKVPFIRECELYGADVTLVDGLITDAGRIAAEQGRPLGWYDMSTLKEPYRIEGKKTMGYEIAEQLGWSLPDWIIYPTGGGTGMVGMWKAFEEMERIGWIEPGRRPKMVSVQAEHCAPIVKAFEQGAERSEMWQGARTVADGLRVPKAVGDFLVLRAVRESGGTALAVRDADMVDGHARARRPRRHQRGARRRRGAPGAEATAARRPRAARRLGRALQHGRRAEVPRRPGVVTSASGRFESSSDRVTI